MHIGLYTFSSRRGFCIGYSIAKGVSERCIARLLLTKVLHVDYHYLKRNQNSEIISIKGVSRLFKTDSCSLKVLWTCVVLLFLSMGFHQSYELFVEYFSYPKVTSIEKHNFSFKDDLDFPIIQVCNVNPVGLMKNVPDNEKFDEFAKVVKNLTSCTNCSEEDTHLLNQFRGDLTTFCGYMLYRGVSRTMELLSNYTDFLIESLRSTCLATKVTVS